MVRLSVRPFIRERGHCVLAGRGPVRWCICRCHPMVRHHKASLSVFVCKSSRPAKAITHSWDWWVSVDGGQRDGPPSSSRMSYDDIATCHCFSSKKYMTCTFTLGPTDFSCAFWTRTPSSWKFTGLLVVDWDVYVSKPQSSTDVFSLN